MRATLVGIGPDEIRITVRAGDLAECVSLMANDYNLEDYNRHTGGMAAMDPDEMLELTLNVGTNCWSIWKGGQRVGLYIPHRYLTRLNGDAGK